MNTSLKNIWTLRQYPATCNDHVFPRIINYDLSEHIRKYISSSAKTMSFKDLRSWIKICLHGKNYGKLHQNSSIDLSNKHQCKQAPFCFLTPQVIGYDWTVRCLTSMYQLDTLVSLTTSGTRWGPRSRHVFSGIHHQVTTLRTDDADFRFYITTVQDGWRKSAFLTRACFPCTIHLIMQYIKPVSEWSCWRMFIETWPHSELTFRHRASSI